MAEKQSAIDKFHPLTGAFGIAEKSFSSKAVNGRKVEEEEEDNEDDHLRKADFPVDLEIDFGDVDLSFARRAYRLANIPEANYMELLCQVPDDGSLILIEKEGSSSVMKIFLADEFRFLWL